MPFSHCASEQRSASREWLPDLFHDIADLEESKTADLNNIMKCLSCQ